MTTLTQTAPAKESRFALFGTALHGLLIVLLAINVLRVPSAMKTFDEYGLTLPWITQTFIQFSLWISDHWILVSLAVFLLLYTNFVLMRFLGRYNRAGQLSWMVGIGLLLFFLECFSLVAIGMPMIKLKEGLSH
jgi:type II secretory pathway component PulF